MKNKSFLVFGSIMLILVIVIFFIIGLSVGAGSQNPVAFTNDTMSAWVAALATVCIAILTIFLAKETWELRLIQLSQIEQIRKDSIKPSVNIYLKPSPSAFSSIDVHINNSGAGVAQNISFSFINKSKETQDIFDHLQTEFSKLVILNNGIWSLSAGEKRTSYLFSFIDLHEKFGDRALDYMAEIDIQFQDLEKKKYSSKSYFNFTEYKGIYGPDGGEPIYKISKTLEKMQKDIGSLITGSKKIKADIYTSSDRRKEKKAHEERRIERAKNSESS